MFHTTSCSSLHFSLFFFNHPATTEIYTLSLHDALPISQMLGVGTTTLISHAGGVKDQSRASRVFNQSFALSDRKSTRLNSSHGSISYAVFCLKKKKRNFQT